MVMVVQILEKIGVSGLRYFLAFFEKSDARFEFLVPKNLSIHLNNYKIYSSKGPNKSKFKLEIM